MNEFLKDDLTVALDDVGRIASRIITVYRDLQALTGDHETAAWLGDEAARRARALERFNAARQGHDQIPRDEDPERAHFHALWLKLKALVTDTPEELALRESLKDLQHHLDAAAAAARALRPDRDITEAMRDLASSSGDDDPG